MEPLETFKRITFEPNAIIFEEGEQGGAVYLIVGGTVEIRIGTRGAQPRVLAARGKGEVFGEMALFDNQPHMATAVALTRTEALVMSREEFRRRVEAMDPLMRGIVLLMVKRLRQMADELIGREADVNWANWRAEKARR